MLSDFILYFFHTKFKSDTRYVSFSVPADDAISTWCYYRSIRLILSLKSTPNFCQQAFPFSFYNLLTVAFYLFFLG